MPSRASPRPWPPRADKPIIEALAAAAIASRWPRQNRLLLRQLAANRNQRESLRHSIDPIMAHSMAVRSVAPMSDRSSGATIRVGAVAASWRRQQAILPWPAARRLSRAAGKCFQ